MCIAIVCLPSCDVINVGINLIFLIKSIFYMPKKSRQKFKYLENGKRFFQAIKKAFFIIFKGLLVVKIVSDLRVRL